MSKMSRRKFLGLGLGAAAAMAGGLLTARGQVRAQELPDDRRFLFVFGAFGGASIIDSFLPLPASAVQPPGDANTLLAYPDEAIIQPGGSNIRCVADLNLSDIFTSGHKPEDFLRSHVDNMAVLPCEVTSVNHIVAQKRAVTGAGVNAGKTIMEAMAERHGSDMILPNCNMSSGGYVEPGDDFSLSERFRAEIIADPRFFALATHGYQGLKDVPDKALIERARGVRGELEDLSHFGLTFKDAPRRGRFLDMRRNVQPRMEVADLIRTLVLLPDSPQTPLSDYGLAPLPDDERERLMNHLPALLTDPLESQAALAFLLARYQVSCALTFGPSFQPIITDQVLGTPLAFDFSHTDHVVAQNVMWGRILGVIDGLVRLLKEQPYDDANPDRGSLWDRSLIYVATDFGRSKTRPSGSLSFGSGHDLNNGNLIISPLVQGNRVWGGIDPTTAMTFGDRGDGTRTIFREGHTYSAIAHALDIDFNGRLDMDFIL